MSYKSCYAQEPKQVLCMPLPDGRTDIWLTQNPEQVKRPKTETEPEQVFYVADEKYIRHSGNVTATEIEANFSEWWESAETAEQAPVNLPIEERVASLENTVDDLIISMLEG